MHRLAATADVPLDAANESLRAHLRGLQLSRSPAYASPAQSAATDLSRLVQEMRRLLRAVTPPNMVLRFQLADSLPLVTADALRLRQMLTHLVAAVGCKAATQQWPLTIRTRMVAAQQPGETKAPALELLLGSESESALALLRWAVISQGRSRTGNMLLAATQALQELNCSLNFAHLPGEGSVAQVVFLI